MKYEMEAFHHKNSKSLAIISALKMFNNREREPPNLGPCKGLGAAVVTEPFPGRDIVLLQGGVTGQQRQK